MKLVHHQDIPLASSLNCPAGQRRLPPHDPADRILLASFDDGRGAGPMSAWEVRTFDPSGSFHAWFAPRGFAHLQLWQPWFALSLLTPSKLTLDRWEAYPLDGWKRAENDFATLARLLESAYAVRLPQPHHLAAWQAMLA